MPNRAWLWLGAAIVVALLVTRWGENDVGRPGPVLLVGDSIFFQSATELERALEDDGWEVITVAYPGAGLAGGGYSDVNWPSQLDETLAETGTPDVAVVELGTNGCAAPCESPSAAIDGVLDELSDVPQVLWLTVRTDAPKPENAAAINQALRRAAADDDDLELLPYHRWLGDSPDLVRPDGVHLNGAGQRELGRRVQDAVAAQAE